MNAHYTANTAKALGLIIPPSILVRADGGLSRCPRVI